MLVAMPVQADDDKRRLSGTVGISSDSSFRGVSQTMRGPALQLSADLELPAGFYAWAWASNVDFVPDGELDDGASHEIDVALGYSQDFGEDIGMEVEFIRYVFPGTHDGTDYDYNELTVTMLYDDRYHGTIAYSNDVDGTGKSSRLYEVGGQFDLWGSATFSLDYGFFDLSEAYGHVYSYTDARVSRQIGNATVALSYIDTHREAGAIYGERVAAPRFVLSLQLAW